MARTFDIDGGGEPILEGSGFDASNAGIGGAGSGDLGGGDAFGGTTLDGPGDPRGGDFVFDADVHISRDRVNADGTYRRKRKRKGSSGNTGKQHTKADLSASVDKLTTWIIIAHTTLASATKTPELALADKEANLLANSLATVLDEFGLDAVVDPKIAAVIGLIGAAGMIYGPRMYLIKERTKNEPKRSASVHTLRTVDNNSQFDGTAQ